MQSHLRSGDRHLLIISDTAMWIGEDGSLKVFEPTLREVENLQEQLFDKITWIGFHRRETARKDGKGTQFAIHFVRLPFSGGRGLMAKTKQVLFFPYYILVIVKYALNHHFIHTRGPSVPAIFGTLFSFLCPRKTYWHKYAGNWVQENPPLSYALQRTLLKKARHATVTVNGKWGSEGTHIKAFENPCLTEDMIEDGRLYAAEKSFYEPLKLCFVGRIEEAKGIKFILKALQQVPDRLPIQQVQLVGSGPHLSKWEEASKAIQGIDITFRGSLDFTSLSQVYRESHALLLPSTASEGFPKVIAEAAAYGCLPMVSGISSITQYVRHQENGLVIKPLEPYKLVEELEYIHNKPEPVKEMALAANKMAQAFTFQRFTEKLKQEVFRFDQ